MPSRTRVHPVPKREIVEAGCDGLILRGTRLFRLPQLVEAEAVEDVRVAVQRYIWEG